MTGIVSNELWSEDRGDDISIIDDGEHEIFGDPDSFAGPGPLLAETVGDRLGEETAGRAKVVALSLESPRGRCLRWPPTYGSRLLQQARQTHHDLDVLRRCHADMDRQLRQRASDR